MEPLWFKEPRVLIDSRYAMSFFPQPWMNQTQRENAIARLILYASCILFISRKDSKAFVLGGIGLVALYLMHFKDDSPLKGPQKLGVPTTDNPMGNPTLFDPMPQQDTSLFIERQNPRMNLPVNDQGIFMHNEAVYDRYKTSFDRMHTVPVHDQGLFQANLGSPERTFNRAEKPQNFAPYMQFFRND